jgi:tetratricopeptide (TPR) repeat protein
VSEYEARLEHGLDALVAARDKEAIEVLTPLLSGASNTAAHRRPQYLHAAYAVGCALYHTQNLTGAATWLGRAFRTLEDLVKEGVEFTPLALGLPLGRFYYAHALFNGQDLRGAKAALLAYVDDVAVAGPQRVLNMPSALSGKDGEISDLERGASRFRARSCSTEAQADAQTMLAMIAEKEEGPEAAGKVLERVLELSTHDRQLADTYDALFKVHTKLGDENKASQCKALAKEHRDKWEASEEEKKALKKKEEAMEEDQVLDEADAPEVVPELAEPGTAPSAPPS